MNIYEQVVDRWKSQGLLRQPAASVDALDAYETTHGVKLPKELRRLLLLANGLTRGEYDQMSHIRFWSLDELALVRECAPGLSSMSYDNHIVFADYSLWAHAYAVSLMSEEIVVVGGVQPIYVTGSLETFLGLYVNDAPALFPKAPESRPSKSMDK